MWNIYVILYCLFAKVVPHYATHHFIGLRLFPQYQRLVRCGIYSPLHVKVYTSDSLDIIIVPVIILILEVILQHIVFPSFFFLFGTSRVRNTRLLLKCLLFLEPYYIRAMYFPLPLSRREALHHDFWSSAPAANTQPIFNWFQVNMTTSLQHISSCMYVQVIKCICCYDLSRHSGQHQKPIASTECGVLIISVVPLLIFLPSLPATVPALLLHSRNPLAEQYPQPGRKATFASEIGHIPPAWYGWRQGHVFQPDMKLHTVGP